MNKNSEHMNIEIVGSNSAGLDTQEIKKVQRIIQAHAADQSHDERISYQLIGLKLRMNSYLNDELHSDVVHAGEFLTELLAIYDIQKNKLAEYIGLEDSNLYSILKGRRKINNKIAKYLESIFDIEEQMWLFIETKNEIKIFNQKHQPTEPKRTLHGLLEKCD